uniref:Uncharacterized protein n=1 Tax=viral metagenome TaxID=1070528 RepID=A0A6M3LJI8_9ZZZZ
MKKIHINRASVLEAFKFFLIRERHRHMQDIVQIDLDLGKLSDIDLVADGLDDWIEIQRGGQNDSK